MKKKNKGFTLIELLVVISIMGLLSSIVLAALTNARQKAENSATVQTVRQFQNQLALYNLDNAGYPNPLGTGPSLYCVGITLPPGASCLGPGSAGTGNMIPIYDTISMDDSSEDDPSFFSWVGTKQAFAGDFEIGFANFETLPHYIVYGCISTLVRTTCSEEDAIIWYPIKDGVSIDWYSTEVTGTPSTYGY